ncbi:MAG: NAD(P)/FAD-dependent oxidoreductase [Brevinema sp.]
MKDIVIIGAGICGSALARELSKYHLDTLVLEKQNDVSVGATKANSGIAHAGYDPKPNTLMAKYNVLGSRMLEQLCKDLTVPYKKTGAVVVAFSQDEITILQTLYDQGITNGIPKECLVILSQQELRQKEPNISDQAIAALWCSETAVISSFELCVGLMESAVINGVEVAKNTQVEAIEKIDEGFLIKTDNPQYNNIKTRFLVNAAGASADQIHNMLAPAPYTITIQRGEYYLLDKKYGSLTNTVVFQCPTKLGKGVLVSPTAHGNLIVGPNAYIVDDPDNTATSPAGLVEVRTLAKKSIPQIPFGANLRNFSGNRAEASTGDFIIGAVPQISGFYQIAGIKSPGLTSAPAIAIDMVDMLEQGGLVLKQKTDFNPYRIVVHLDYLSLEERAKLIATNPLYGRIVCYCENVSEGEIIDAIRRPNGGSTIEGVKKRTRVCAGPCQGGLCMSRIAQIIAREKNIELSQVYQDKENSYMVIPRGAKND